mmetsp:Transcript_54546/g.84794  ORF Transcript_54546/g.84794 Transcript_54546/m.84794 type:complete len:824 (-) Transcript_54546:13-2484(-)
MGLFDGFGSYDTPERRSAVKRQQAALLSEQIAEKQHLEGLANVAISKANVAPPPLPVILPEPSWPWKAGAVPPLQAWRTPPAATKPLHFPMFPMQVGWPPQGMRSHSDGTGRSHNDHYVARSNLGPGVGRGVARPITSTRGGWLAPQMRSSADELIYGHDLDGYGSAPRAPRASPRFDGQQPLRQQQQQIPSTARRAASQPTQEQISEAQKAIDEEWQEWERQHPELRRRRRMTVTEGGEAPQVVAPEATTNHPVAKATKKHVVDIDAEWAEWESRHPEFQRRRKRKDTGGDASLSSGTASVPGASQAIADSLREVVASRAGSPTSNPSAFSAVIRPPLLPPQVPVPVDRPQLSSRRPEDFRTSASSSFSDELRRLRHSCSDQRALLHLEVEKLKAQASRVLAEQSQMSLAPLKRMTPAYRLESLAAPPLRPLGLDRHHLQPFSLSPLLQDGRPSLSAYPASALVDKFGSVGSGFSPELAVAELRLGAMKPEQRLPDALRPVLPGYPRFTAAPSLDNIDLQQEGSGGILPEASTLVFLDDSSETPSNAPPLQQPAASLPSSSCAPAPVQGSLRRQERISNLEDVENLPSKTSDIDKEKLPTVMANGEDAGSKESASLRVPSKEECLSMDSLRYSGTCSVFGTTPPQQAGSGDKLDQVAFSRVMDLGAALRGLSGEQSTVPRESSPTPTDEGNIANETMLVPATKASSEVTNTPPSAENNDSSLLREVTPPLEAIPGVGEMAKAPSLPGLPAPSPRSSPSWSPNVSPRRILPRPKTDDTESRQGNAQEETEASADQRRTQDFLMDVLIPETQGHAQSSTEKASS